MPPRQQAVCDLCGAAKAVMKRPKNGQKLCKECFYHVFETEVHNTITSARLFSKGEVVAIGALGGKDSTVLAYVLKLLNHRYDYGLELVLLSVDEGIKGYRDDLLATVHRNQKQYDMPLTIVSYRDLYDWLMDEIVECAGVRSSCTYCGVLRRQALDRGAAKLNINHVVTGHNADDMAETTLMNLLRGDVARLELLCAILTQSSGLPIKRSKPFKYTYEKEVVLYAHYRQLDYFSTECTYSTEAFRGTARTLLKLLEAVRPLCIIDIIHSGEHFVLREKKKRRTPPAVNPNGTVPLLARDEFRCEKCGYFTPNQFCQACVLLKALEPSRPKVAVAVEEQETDGAAKVLRQLERLAF